MNRFSIIRWALAPVLALAACAGDDARPDPGGAPGDDPGDDRGEARPYRYTLGVDPATGASHHGGSHEIVVLGERGKKDAIDTPNRPERLHPRLGDAAYQKLDTAITGGETDWEVFASNWWPQSGNGIAFRWYDDEPSPTEKYDELFHPGQLASVAEVEHWNYQDLLKPVGERPDKHTHEARMAGPATRWELQHHGVYQDWAHPDSWWGHCNGWASYATAEPLGYPLRDVTVKLVDGEIVECTTDTTGCVTFRMGDIEGLMSELYFSDKATFAGQRCDTDPAKIERDEYGRPVDSACRDLNPGSFHIAVVGLLSRGAKHHGTGLEGKPAFIIDHNYDWEVWNFPVSRFEIAEQVEITRAEAVALVGAEGDGYVFNEQAAKFARVKLDYWMISDGVSWSKMRLRADQRNVEPHRTTLNYVLEMAEDGTILGGEWIQDPTTTWGENSKELHPDFFWMAVNHSGWGESTDDTGGNDDNPYISYKHVQALLACANEPATCNQDAPPPPPPPASSCQDRCGGQADGCWCDNSCTQYGDCCADYEAICVLEPEPEPEPDPEPEPEPDPEPEPEPEPMASCVNHCGATSPAPGSAPACYCDGLCENYGDCCTDYAAVCGG